MFGPSRSGGTYQGLDPLNLLHLLLSNVACWRSRRNSRSVSPAQQLTHYLSARISKQPLKAHNEVDQ